MNAIFGFLILRYCEKSPNTIHRKHLQPCFFALQLCQATTFLLLHTKGAIIVEYVLLKSSSVQTHLLFLPDSSQILKKAVFDSGHSEPSLSDLSFVIAVRTKELVKREERKKERERERA